MHIAKYISRYQELFPTACILVIKSFFRYYFSPASARQELSPAVEVIDDILAHSSLPKLVERKRPQILIHVFSNGGSCMLYHLYDVYASPGTKSPGSLERKDKVDLRILPQHVTIFDSVPGRWSYTGSTQGVLAGIPAGWPRTLASPLVYLLGLWWVVKYMLIKIPEETHVWGLAHNDPAWARETARSYVYSEADSLVGYRDVEEHAEHAEANGFVVVRRQKFVDSMHVAHARGYPDEYWALVKETWEGGC